MDLFTTIRKVMAPLERRVMMLISRGVVELVKNSTKLQTVQVTLLADEVRDCEHFEAYGFTSVAKAGAEALFFAIGSNRDHGAVVAISDRRTRPTTLAEGDSAMWTSGQGVLVKAQDADGTVELGPSPTDFAANAALVDARLDAIESHLASLQTWADTHTQPPFGAPTSPSPSPPSGSSTAATKVKVK